VAQCITVPPTRPVAGIQLLAVSNPPLRRAPFGRDLVGQPVGAMTSVSKLLEPFAHCWTLRVWHVWAPQVDGLYVSTQQSHRGHCGPHCPSDAPSFDHAADPQCKEPRDAVFLSLNPHVLACDATGLGPIAKQHHYGQCSPCRLSKAPNNHGSLYSECGKPKEVEPP
jgi:hypothetical protein